MAVTPVGTPVITATVSGTSHTIDYEAANAGDLRVAVVRISFTDAFLTDIAANGWTLLGQRGTAGTCTIIGKWVSSNESAGSVTFTSAATGNGLSSTFRLTGVDQNDWLAVSAAVTNGGNAISNIVLPDFNTDTDNAFVLWAFTSNVSDTVTFSQGTELFDTSSGSRQVAVAYRTQATAGAVGTNTITLDTTTGNISAVALAFKPASASGPETLVPTTGGTATNLNSNTYDASLIDDATATPGAYPGDWLVGSDPSPASTQHPLQYADARALWTGSAAHTWTNEANARDTSDATFASYALGANSTDYIDHWSFNAADFTGIPVGATITGMQVLVRMRAGTNNRLTAWIQMATANGSVLGNEYQVDGGTAIPTTVGDFGGNATWDTMPTRAQLVTGTFGIRTRIRRSNTVTCEMYSIKVTVTYVDPASGQTVNTEVRAPMTDPVGTLATGATSGTLKIRVGKKGTGSNPQVRAELRNAAGTLLGTPIANTTVSALASAGGVELTNTFNQSLVGSGSDVVVWVVGTGASGGLVEVDSIEWVAQVQTTQSLSHTINVTAGITSTLGKSVSKNIARSILGSPSIQKAATKGISFGVSASAIIIAARAQLRTLTFSATATPSLIRAAAKVLAISPTITSTQRKAVSKTLSRPVTASPSILKAVSKSLSMGASVGRSILKAVAKSVEISSNAQPTMHKNVGARRAFTTSATNTLKKDVAKTLSRAVNAGLSISTSITQTFTKNIDISVSTSLSMLKGVTRSITIPVNPTVSLQVLRVQLKNLAFSVVGTPTVRKSISIIRSFSPSGALNLRRQVSRILPFSPSAGLMLRKTVAKTLSRTVSAAVSLNALKVQLKSLAFSVTASPTVRKTVEWTRAFSTSAALVTRRQVFKDLGFSTSGILGLNKAITKTLSKTVGVVVGITTSSIRNIERVLSFSVSAGTTLRKTVDKLANFNSTGDVEISKAVGKSLLFSLEITSTVRKAIERTMNFGVSVVAKVTGGIVGVITGAYPKVKIAVESKPAAIFISVAKSVASFAVKKKPKAKFERET